MKRLVQLSEQTGSLVDRRRFLRRALGMFAGSALSLVIPGMASATCGLTCSPFGGSSCPSCSPPTGGRKFTCHNICDGSNSTYCSTHARGTFCLDSAAREGGPLAPALAA
jgi:hypothetical protein